jgi:putative membrane protein
MKTKTRILLAMLLPLLYLTQACDDPKTSKKYNNETAVDVAGLHFMENVADAGLTEIKAAKVAEKISTNPRVVGFAKMMITDHTAADAKLNKLRKVENVDATTDIDRAHEAMIDSLSKMSGPAFDKAYMEMMVDGHREAVDLFRQGKENRANAVQNFAAEYLPTIGMHLDSAKAILASLK